MRRKIIKQGNNSYTLTLPIGWIRELSLQEGEDVNIEQEDGKLVVSPEKVKKKKETIAFLDEEYEKNITYTLNEIYRQGYDRARISFKNKKVLQILQKDVEKLFFDMEIMEKNPNYCVVEVISEPSIENYNSILKKMIFIIHESMDIIIRSIEKKKFGEALQVEELTAKYRRYDNFCRRYVYTYIKGAEGFEMNSLLVQLLMIQTDLRRAAVHAASKKRTELNKELFAMVAEHYKKVYHAFLKKDIKTLYGQNKKINSLIAKHSAGTKKDTLFAHYSLEILRILYSAIVPMVGLAIEVKKEPAPAGSL